MEGKKWSYNIHPNKQNLFGAGLPTQAHTLKARGGVRGQKNKFGLYQSPTCYRVTTLYRMSISFIILCYLELLNDSRKQRADRKASLEDVLGGTFGYESYSMTWVSGKLPVVFMKFNLKPGFTITGS